MGKLGGKARKFAKKNLQSVSKRKRKLKSMFKKRAPKKGDEGGEVEGTEERKELSSRRNLDVENINDYSLDAVFGEDDSDIDEDDSDVDGYLSEEASIPGAMETEDHLEDINGNNASSEKNKEILLEVSKKRKKLDRLKDKDEEFSKFLESNRKRFKMSQDDEDYSSEDEASEGSGQFVNGNITRLEMGKLLSSSAVDTYYRLVIEQDSVPALIKLLNGYRAACHYGSESSSLFDSSGTFSKILMLMLHEANNMFRKMLGISSSNERKAIILDLKNTPKWKTLKPLVKSYLRSTLNLLNEASDPQILSFTLKQLGASIVLFAAFPPLLRRLIKISVHLWATGEGTLPQQSFLIIKDVATVFNAECFDTCLIKAYKSFINHCRFVDPVLYMHIQFLKNSLVELCSQDVQKSSSKAITSIKQLAKILQLGLQTKKKEALKLIRSWQFANCIDLWVAFISVNIGDNEDLQPFLYMIIQVINGMANLFPGPRYLPLRIKCVQWLNHLSRSSQVFISVASFALDILEYKVGKEGRKPGKNLNVSSTTKLPKPWLKSRKFQEECVFSAIELLATHFVQWSYHISFPELATIPLIRLKKFLEINTIESFRRVVKRFVDQVEQNSDFVRRKRDEVAFSPKDQQSVDSFLQLEKSAGNAPFMQYYRSVMERAASRNVIPTGKKSFLKQEKQKDKRLKLPIATIVE